MSLIELSNRFSMKAFHEYDCKQEYQSGNGEEIYSLPSRRKGYKGSIKYLLDTQANLKKFILATEHWIKQKPQHNAKWDSKKSISNIPSTLGSIQASEPGNTIQKYLTSVEKLLRFYQIFKLKNLKKSEKALKKITDSNVQMEIMIENENKKAKKAIKGPNKLVMSAEKVEEIITKAWNQVEAPPIEYLEGLSKKAKKVIAKIRKNKIDNVRAELAVLGIDEKNDSTSKMKRKILIISEASQTALEILKNVEMAKEAALSTAKEYVLDAKSSLDDIKKINKTPEKMQNLKNALEKRRKTEDALRANLTWFKKKCPKKIEKIKKGSANLANVYKIKFSIPRPPAAVSSTHSNSSGIMKSAKKI